MVGSRSSKLVPGVAALLVVLGLLSYFGWKTVRQKRQQAEARQAASRQVDVAALLHLSAVRTFSAEEKARLDRAGTNPGDVQRALLEIHELRLAFARRELQAAQEQRAELGGGAARQAAPARVQAVRKQEQTAAAEVARYADALSSLQSWRPGSRQEDVGSTAAAQAGAGKAADGPGQPGQSTSAANAGSAAGAAPQENVAAEELPTPAPAEVADAARHPTITVYPDGVAAGAEAPAVSELAKPAGADMPAPPAKNQDVAAEVAPRNAPTVPDRARDQAEILATLQRWAHAMMLNDPRAETAEYSPHMDRYFLYRNVDRSFVQADKAAYLRRGNITARFTLENVHFDRQTPDSADISLVKDVAWQRSPDGATRKLIRSRLHLVRTGQGWKIAGEQDLR